MKVNESVLFQDNMSSMLLEENGRASSSKRTRHMNICFFFIKDRVESKEVCIEYCPTGEMLADFFIKPLQGKQFFKLQDQVMNIDPDSKYHSDHRSVLSEKYEITDDVANAMDSGNKELGKLRKELGLSGVADVVRAGGPSGQMEDEA